MRLRLFQIEIKHNIDFCGICKKIALKKFMCFPKSFKNNFTKFSRKLVSRAKKKNAQRNRLHNYAMFGTKIRYFFLILSYFVKFNWIGPKDNVNHDHKC